MNSNETEILTVINRLLASFPASQAGQGDEVVDAYMIGLSGIASPYVAQAAANFLQGTVAKHNNAFAPSPAELAAEARRIWHLEIDRRSAQDQIRQQFQHRIENKITPEQAEERKEFVRKQLARLKPMPKDDARIPVSMERAIEDLNELSRRKPEKVEVSAALVHILERN